tara:strand:+ start:707 stop:1447 length:741 start_codon:yes stop_codon:yes gene_type:complete
MKASVLNQFGISRAQEGRPLHRTSGDNFYLVDQTNRHVEIFDDFIHSSVSDAVDGEGAWGASLASGGSTTFGDESGGALIVASDNTDNDEVLLRSHDEWFTFDATKNLKFEARVKSNIVVHGTFIGLSELGIALGQADGTLMVATESCCGFWMQEAASILFNTCNDTTNTSTDTGVDRVADTYNVFTFTYTASDKTWRAYIDGTLKVTSTATTNPASAMGIQIGHRNQSGAIGTTTIDYVYCSAEM